jgi:large subunit ribosomal protein L16
MLTPKRTKHRKAQKGRSLTRVFEGSGTLLENGTVGLKSTEVSRITSRQIESARRVLLRYITKGGKI